MKILQINAVADAGSTGEICRQINEMLLHQGHQGMILYGNGESTYPYACKVSGKYGVKLHGLMSRVLGKNAAYSPIATGKVLRKIRAFQPDVVHLHNLHGNYVNLNPLLRYLAKKNIATVITLHDCWFFTGKCTHYTQAGCSKWETGCHDCPRLKEDIPALFFDRTAQMWKEKKQLFNAIPRLAVVGVSDWITNEGRKSPCFSNAKIITRIYNWIDTKTFYPRQSDIKEKYHIPGDRFTVLCIGAGWSRQASRSQELLKLAAMLPQDCQIVLAGNVPFADELPENVRYIGYVRSAEELAQLYSAADVYAHLSREDTFGKVIAEALACGTPAVVYDSTACPELVKESCGAIVAPGDTEGLLQAIMQVREKGKAAYSENCVAAVQGKLEREKLLQDTINLYAQLIQS